MTGPTPDDDDPPEVGVNDVDAQDDAEVFDDQASLPFPDDDDDEPVPQ